MGEPFLLRYRTIVSLLLFMHLFCVAVVLGSQVFRSVLLRDLTGVVAPYTKTLHLDPDSVPFQLTAGQDGSSRLHQWQVIDGDQITHRFPDRQWRGGFNRERQEMFARVGAIHAVEEGLNAEVPAIMSQAIAEHVFSQGPVSNRLLIRCVRYVGDSSPQSDELESPDIGVLYEAVAWLGDSGTVNVLKQEEPYRLAPPTNVK